MVFYGCQKLRNITEDGNDHATDEMDESFAVEQEQGYATIHYGHHPHRTLDLIKGHRTNVVLTYCYKDERRSDVKSRLCYAIK